MQLSRRERTSVIDGVIALINQLDPNEVEPGNRDGTPWDEYVNEAHPMASLLINKGSITTGQVDAIWQRWFSEPLSVVVGAARAEEFTASLTALIGPAES